MVYLVWMPILNSEFLRITLIGYSKMEFWLVKSTKVFQRNQKICDLLSSGSADCEKLFFLWLIQMKRVFSQSCLKRRFLPNAYRGKSRFNVGEVCSAEINFSHQTHTELFINQISNREIGQVLVQRSGHYWYPKFVKFPSRYNLPPANLGLIPNIYSLSLK